MADSSNMYMNATLNFESLPVYPILDRYEEWCMLEQYGLEFIKNYNAIKVEENENSVKVALAPDSFLKEVIPKLIRHHSPKDVQFFRMSSADFRAATMRLFARSEESGQARPDEDRLSLETLSGDAPTVNLVNSIILDAVGSGATDIHVEKDERQMRIRYRLDGLLTSAGNYSPERFASVSSRIKLMANLNIMETRKPQDGRLSMSLEGEELHMRVSVVPLVRGESLVLRLFHREEDLIGTSHLGFPESTWRSLKDFFVRPHGLLLATGPTGSGKTTTLSAFLSELKESSRKIITIEDPVEYIIPGINQIQVNEDVGLGFGQLLRRVLRQDPDVIMVGEIRDEETALLAVRAALTGHPVLASLHTNDAPSAVNRLVDMGVPRYLLAAVLKGVLAQRLVRKLCPACRVVRKALPIEKKLAAAYGTELKEAGESVGCDGCNGIGYLGRTVVSEWFAVNEELEELIATEGITLSRFQGVLEARGFAHLAEDGFSRVADGTTSVEELKRTVLD